MLWFESNTHLKNGNYEQAFLTAWILLERRLYSVFSSYPEEKKLSYRGKRKWRVDEPALSVVLSALKVERSMEPSVVDSYQNLNSYRTGFVHFGKSIPEEIAIDCVSKAKQLILEELKNLR